MLSLVFKKCVFHTQMQPFTTLLMCSRNQDKKKLIHYQTKFECMNAINLNPPVRYRPFASTAKEKINLPCLMDVPVYLKPSRIILIKLCFANIYMLARTGGTFNFIEFSKDARQAIKRISHALANEDYEELDGLVQDKTLEILKQSVSRLTPEQRNLLASPKVWRIEPIIFNTFIERGKDKDNDFIIKVLFFGTYNLLLNIPTKGTPKHEIRKMVAANITLQHLIVCNYTFEKNYVNGTGGSWIVTAVNHCTYDHVAKV